MVAAAVAAVWATPVAAVAERQVLDEYAALRAARIVAVMVALLRMPAAKAVKTERTRTPALAARSS